MMNIQFQSPIFFILTIFCLTFQGKADAIDQPNQTSAEELVLPSKPKNDSDSSQSESFDWKKFEEEANAPNQNNDDKFFGNFVSMLITLGLLVAAMIFASWFLKRMLQSRIQHLNTASNIKILEQRALSTKASIHLIEVLGRTFLIAESVNGIANIAEFDPESMRE